MSYNLNKDPFQTDSVQKSKKFSTASFICLGIAAITFWLCVSDLEMIYVSMPFNIIALILAIIAKAKDKNNSVAMPAIILSIVGMILSYIGYNFLVSLFEVADIFETLCDCGGMS